MKTFLYLLIFTTSQTILLAQGTMPKKILLIDNINFYKAGFTSNYSIGSTICFKNKFDNMYDRINFGYAVNSQNQKKPEDLSNIYYYGVSNSIVRNYYVGFGQEYHLTLKPNFYVVIGADAQVNFATNYQNSTQYAKDTATNLFVGKEGYNSQGVTSALRLIPFIGARFTRKKLTAGLEVFTSANYISYFSSTPDNLFFYQIARGVL